VEPKSRTEKKKDAHHLQDFGEKLVALSSQQLLTIGLPEELLKEIQFAKTLTKHGAYRRQMQHIGALMREFDPEPILQAVRVIEQGDYKKSRNFHQIESWRDELINGNESLLEEVFVNFPDAERQRLTQLVRSAQKEKIINRSKKSARNLFAYLRQLQDTK
jgi:ribosome-associated protein